VVVGQSLALRGVWVEHTQYGKQLRASDMSELSPATSGEMEAYLGGGAIPGVGPATAKVGRPHTRLPQPAQPLTSSWPCVRALHPCPACPAPPTPLHSRTPLPPRPPPRSPQRLVARWGADIESKLSSPRAVQYLQECDSIGRSKAEKIKRAWDASKGAGCWPGGRGPGEQRGCGGAALRTCTPPNHFNVPQRLAAPSPYTHTCTHITHDCVTPPHPHPPPTHPRTRRHPRGRGLPEGARHPAAPGATHRPAARAPHRAPPAPRPLRRPGGLRAALQVGPPPAGPLPAAPAAQPRPPPPPTD
jgi:hypothetical protein